jgi:hypothetical protein
MGTSGASTAANSSTAAAAGSTARTRASESSIELGAVSILGGTVTISRAIDQDHRTNSRLRCVRKGGTEKSPHLEALGSSWGSILSPISMVTIVSGNFVVEDGTCFVFCA